MVKYEINGSKLDVKTLEEVDNILRRTHIGKNEIGLEGYESMKNYPINNSLYPMDRMVTRQPYPKTFNYKDIHNILNLRMCRTELRQKHKADIAIDPENEYQVMFVQRISIHEEESHKSTVPQENSKYIVLVNDIEYLVFQSYLFPRHRDYKISKSMDRPAILDEEHLFLNESPMDQFTDQHILIAYTKPNDPEIDTIADIVNLAMEAKLIDDDTELNDETTKFLESLLQRITDQQRSIPVCAIDADFERRLAHQMFINELKCLDISYQIYRVIHIH